MRFADVQPDGAGFKEEPVQSAIGGQCRAAAQRIGRGSRAVVLRATALVGIESFTLQVAVWPTLLDAHRQALLGNWDTIDRSGFALFLDERGVKYAAHFDGKLEAPRVSSGDLSDNALTVLSDISQPERLRDRVVGWWDFSLEIEGRRIVDRSENGLHGHLENLPTRGVTGLACDGREHDWRHAPERYAAIHFHSDVIYDAGWDADWDDAFTLDVPNDWKSGIYAARLRTDGVIDPIPFFVAPPRGSELDVGLAWSIAPEGLIMARGRRERTTSSSLSSATKRGA